MTQTKKTNVLPIRVISKNIRYATKTPDKGEEPWSKRKSHLVNELSFNSLHQSSTLICCQEVLHEQLQDILAGLREFDQWDSIGWGRDNGKKAGEYSPILFRPAVWQVIESNPTWLSPTPDVPSIDPDAGSIRILTRAKLKHKSSGCIIVVYCTHLDNASSAARRRAAEQICSIAIGDAEFPIIMAGDFNSEQHQEAYQTVTHSGVFHDISSNDTIPKYGDFNTFTGFRPKHEKPRVLDYIFTHSSTNSKSNSHFIVRYYAVLPNRFEDSIFNSDHRAVVADILLHTE